MQRTSTPVKGYGIREYWENQMERRRLGTSDLDLTVIGLGTWAIGGEGWDYAWGPQEESDSIRAIHEALDSGVNWIDTAAVYGLGRAEELIAKALKQCARRPIVATKCGLIGDEKGRITGNLSRASIRREVEMSLRRLAVETIDLYQIHWPRPPNQIDEAWRTLQDLTSEGKIRWAGVSNFSAEQMEQVSAIAPVTSLQPPYSLLKRDVEKEELPWCRKRGGRCNCL